MKLEARGSSQTSVIARVKGSAKGVLPKAVEKLRLVSSVRVIDELRMKFDRSDAADRINTRAGSVMMFEDDPGKDVLPEEEAQQFDRLTILHKSLDLHAFTEIGGFFTHPLGSLQFFRDSSRALVRGKVIVDAPLEQCASYVYRDLAYASRKSTQNIFDDGGHILSKRVVSPKCSISNQLTKDFGSDGYDELLFKTCWRREAANEISVATWTFTDDEHFPRQEVANRRLNYWGYSRLFEKSMDSSGEETVNLTKIEIILCVELPGKASETLGPLERGLLKRLGKTVKDIQVMFDNSKSTGDLKRARFKDEVEKAGYSHRGVGHHNDKERAHVLKSVGLFNAFTQLDQKTNVTGRASLSRDFLGVNTNDHTSNGKLYCRTKIVVNAELLDCLGFAWDTESRSNHTGATVMHSIIEQDSLHKKLVHSIVELPFGNLINRNFLDRLVWMKTKANEYVLACQPEENKKVIRNVSRAVDNSDDGMTQNRISLKTKRKMRFSVKVGETRQKSFFDKKNTIRAKAYSCWRFTRVSDSKTLAEYVVKLDLGVSRSFCNSADFQKTVSRQYIGKGRQMQQYFDEGRTLCDLNFIDGKALGCAFLSESSIETTHRRLYKDKMIGASWAQLRVDEVIKKYKSLTQLIDVEGHVWFRPMMVEILKNKLSQTESVQVKLTNLSQAEGILLGKSLSLNLATNLTPSSGIDSWLINYPAMVQFDIEYEWFRPMLEEICQHLLNEVAWGTRLRLQIGGMISLASILSDIAVTLRYFSGSPSSEESNVYGFVMVIIFFFNIFVETGLNAMQNGITSRTFWRAQMFVLTGTKPVMDSWIVATGQKTDAMRGDKKELIDPMQMLTMSRLSEVFTEAIPGCVLQLFAFLKSGGSKTAAFSIFVSLVSVSYTSACISFDLDTSPTKREQNPAFYGYTPNSAIGRGISFTFLLSSAFFSASLRIVFVTLVLLINPNALAWYFFIDLTIFVLYKVSTRDFGVFLNVKSKVGHILVSFNNRLLSKIASDNAAIIHMRSPTELGGLYWSVSQVLGAAAPLVAFYFYNKDEGAKENVDLHLEAWMIACLAIAWVLR